MLFVVILVLCHYSSSMEHNLLKPTLKNRHKTWQLEISIKHSFDQLSCIITKGEPVNILANLCKQLKVMERFEYWIKQKIEERKPIHMKTIYSVRHQQEKSPTGNKLLVVWIRKSR